VSRYFDNYWKEFKSMASRSHKHTKTESLLVNLAESIGSTLGSLAAKADAAQKALARSDLTSTIERKGRKLIRKTKEAAGAATRKATRKVSRGKAASTGMKSAATRKAKSARGAVRRTVKRAKRAAAGTRPTRSRT
jgi:hypothetical protein